MIYEEPVASQMQFHLAFNSKFGSVITDLEFSLEATYTRNTFKHMNHVITDLEFLLAQSNLVKKHI